MEFLRTLTWEKPALGNVFPSAFYCQDNKAEHLPALLLEKALLAPGEPDKA